MDQADYSKNRTKLPPSLGGAPHKKRGNPHPMPGYRRLWAEPPGSSNEVAPLGGATPVTCVAHEYRLVLIRIAGDDEFGFIVDAALAFAAKPEFVFIPFG